MTDKMENWLKLITQQRVRGEGTSGHWLRVPASSEELRNIVQILCGDIHWAFAGIVPERDDAGDGFHLLYVFYSDNGVLVGIEVHNHEQSIPTISDILFAADWQEREMEDLFNLSFKGHPQLGNFVLHDEQWPEGLAPMARDIIHILGNEKAAAETVTPQIVKASGSFVMTVGPIFSGSEESIQFFLETVGEEIIFAHIRPFYKYRAIEKLLEGKSFTVALLLAERINGHAAFAHAWALAQALERLSDLPISARAQRLRVFWAEFERIRLHVRTLARILESTGLSVPANLMHALEEDLLQLGAIYGGHRYLFGLLRLGGLSRDWSASDLEGICARVDETVSKCEMLIKNLTFDNSFLDRLESVGMLTKQLALDHGLVGPVARASGLQRDLRKWQTYGAYRHLKFDVPTQNEGDGYARFRQLFDEILQSAGLMKQIPQDFSNVDAVSRSATFRSGMAFGAVEGPNGAIFYNVGIRPDGTVKSCRIITPGLVNWHAFPDAIRHFTFQDFPIILATFGLSVADLDR